MHLALFRIYDGCKSVEHRALRVCTLNSLDNVGKLTYARGLDKDSVGCKFIDDLLKRRGKITHKRTTNTSRVHLVDLYSRFSKKPAVNTDLTKLVFDKDDLFTRIRFLKKLLYKRCLSRTEKSRKNINSCHF